MNTYYHQFQLTFNAWFVLLPFCMILMGMFGSRRYYLESNTMRIKRRGRKFSISSFIAVNMIEIMLIVLVIRESSMGIVQICANSLGQNDSAIYALIAAFMLQLVLFLLFYVLLTGSVKIGEYVQLGYLMEKRREAKINQAGDLIMFPN